tara:strand:+ start:5619 stop:6482 length:864 start_codon:yes stop_codon:yes gene_type:complete
MIKKILILGSSGTLGKVLFKTLSNKYEVYHNGIRKRKVNILNKNKLAKFLTMTNPDLIINSAAAINIDYCEKNKNFTKRINVDAIKNIFLIKSKYNLSFKFIQISTDQMYNRKNKLPSSESVKPLIYNEYTRQKVRGEKICLKQNSIILRTNFISYKKKNFFYWIVNAAKSKKKIFLFKDIFFNPLNALTLAKTISKIIYKLNNREIYGIYNLGTKDYISKSDFCEYIIKKLKLDSCDYNIVLSDKYFKTKRPKNMKMNTEKFQKQFRIKLPLIKNEINKCLLEINA